LFYPSPVDLFCTVGRYSRVIVLSTLSIILPPFQYLTVTGAFALIKQFNK